MAASMAKEMSRELKNILKENPYLIFIEDTNKVKCTLSGHEMPCQLNAVTSYINGKKYKKLISDASVKDSIESYKQHLVPSTKKGHEKHLFCQLTLRHLNNQPHHIERHIKGRRFTKALARWEQCQKTGEKFVPRLGRTRPVHHAVEQKKTEKNSKQKEFWDSDSDVDDEEKDDLSDLYPAEDFASESEDSDFEFENLEVLPPVNDKQKQEAQETAKSKTKISKKSVKRHSQNDDGEKLVKKSKFEPQKKKVKKTKV